MAQESRKPVNARGSHFFPVLQNKSCFISSQMFSIGDVLVCLWSSWWVWTFPHLSTSWMSKCCLCAHQVSVYLQNWSHVLSYVNKAESTPEIAEVSPTVSQQIWHLLQLRRWFNMAEGWVQSLTMNHHDNWLFHNWHVLSESFLLFSSCSVCFFSAAKRRARQSEPGRPHQVKVCCRYYSISWT